MSDILYLYISRCQTEDCLRTCILVHTYMPIIIFPRHIYVKHIIYVYTCLQTNFLRAHICQTYCINEQKALRRDCIYNNENTDLELGVSGVYLHLL